MMRREMDWLAIGGLLLGSLAGCKSASEPTAAPPPPRSAVASVAPAAVTAPAPSAAATAATATAATATAQPEGNIPLRWSPKLGLADVAAIPAALTAKLRPNGEALTLTSTDKTPPGRPEKISVEDCKQYLAAIEEKYAPVSTFDITQESFFKDRCTPLRFLQIARPSRTSHVGAIRLDKDPLAVLPASMNIEMEGPSDEQKAAIAKGQPLGAYSPALKVTRKDATSVVFVDPEAHVESRVDIIAWGDFDHDGLEDLLLFQSTHSLEGSFRAYTLVVVTRKGANEPLLEISRFD
jgi:hypothetical protein